MHLLKNNTVMGKHKINPATSSKYTVLINGRKKKDFVRDQHESLYHVISNMITETGKPYHGDKNHKSWKLLHYCFFQFPVLISDGTSLENDDLHIRCSYIPDNPLLLHHESFDKVSKHFRKYGNIRVDPSSLHIEKKTRIHLIARLI